MIRDMRIYTIDEMMNMPITDLEKMEDEAWNYRKRIIAVISLRKEIEGEEE